MAQYLVAVNVPQKTVPHSPKQVAEALALGVASLGVGEVTVTLDPTARLTNDSPPTVQLINTVENPDGFRELPNQLDTTMTDLGVDMMAGDVKYRAAVMDHPILGGIAILITDWTGPAKRFQVAIVLDAHHMRVLGKNLMSTANAAANRAETVDAARARDRGKGQGR